MHSMLSLEGKQLGNYDVIRPIRVGGMGAVYEGRQRTAFGRRVAIKVIHNDYAGDRDMRRRFAREARTIARLQHPYILPLIEFGDEQGILYLVMPLIEGGTLTSYLRRNLPDLTEVASIYQQLLDAVEYAHEEGLIHRDIKSSNVLLEMRRNGPPHVYLADFGLVRFIRPNDAVQVGKPIPLEEVPGTPHYMAPEQTRGIVTPLTDIYALGVMLYQLLTGVLPYNDPNEVRVIQMHLSAPIPSPCDHDASIPYELGEVVKTAMAKHPDDRYQSVGELRKAFLAALKGPAAYGLDAETREEKPDLRGTYPPYRLQTKSLREEDRSLSLPLQKGPALPPEPIVLQRKMTTRELPGWTQALSLQPSQESVNPVYGESANKLERADRVRTTDSVQENRSKRNDLNKIRNTEEPVLQGQVAAPPTLIGAQTKGVQTRKAKQRHPFRTSLIVALILIVILLAASQALGMNIIPAVSGTQATIQITEKVSALQESYVLTAAPQYTAPDANTFAMPARVLQSTSTDGDTTATTGLKTTGGSVAQGRLLFTNTGPTAVVVPAGQEFITAAGIHIKLLTTTSISVPGIGQDQNEGTAIEPASAVDAGVAGNIASHALQATFAPQVTVQNIDPFTGGADGQTVHVVAQSDIDGLLTSLRKKLTQEADQQLQNQLAAGEVMAGKPSYSETIISSPAVGTQLDQVQVNLRVQESIPVYKPAVAIQVATTLLDTQANHNLGNNFKRQGEVSSVNAPVVSAVKNNTIILSVTVHGNWIYNFTSVQVEQWRQAIQGLTPASAQAYLKTQKGITDAHIQLPTGSDHLPTVVGNIKIELR
jgi:serine/threonine protein kinase/uncharacterized lipoprotein YmbA